MLLTSSGYVYKKIHGHSLADKRGRVREHRKVWFDAHGAIPDGHIVHHLNGDKTDNRLENLELCSRAQHGKAHHGRRIMDKPEALHPMPLQFVQGE